MRGIRGNLHAAAIAAACVFGVLSASSAQAQSCPPNTQLVRTAKGPACLDRAQIQKLEQAQQQRQRELQHQQAVQQQRQREQQQAMQQQRQREQQQAMQQQRQREQQQAMQQQRQREQQQRQQQRQREQQQRQQGCVQDGNVVRCPSQMKTVGVGPGCVEEGGLIKCPSKIRQVEATPIKRVEATPIKRVESTPIKRVESTPIKRYEPSQGNSDSPVPEGAGQGLNQAQIDAMERQRQLMWNSTGPGMVYR